jgi:23S rRNA pseudouridine1911/1915/1917 synthase
VHLQSIGHPIIGDKIYGSTVEQFIRFCRGEQTHADREQLRLPRHALHAARLTIAHPATKERMTFEAPLAPDLQAFCDDEITWDDA